MRKSEPDTWKGWRRVALVQALVTALVGAATLTAIVLTATAVIRWAADKGTVNLTGLDDWKEIGLGIIAVFSAAEGFVVAWSREHHEQLTRSMTEHFALPPEDPAQRPRIRLSLRWIGRRLRRWARGVRALFAVLPVAALISLCFYPLKLQTRVLGLLLLGWSLYWGTLIACGKTAYAWRTEDDPNAPAPALVRALRRVPVIALFGRYLGWMTRTSAPAAREVDENPWEFFGLTVARLMLGLPFLYAFVRPTLPLSAVLVLSTPPPR